MFTERAGKIANLEKMLDKDVYVLCHNRNKNAIIDGSMIYVLRRIMENSKRRDCAALIIQTSGGLVDEAYYIGTFFREYYDYIETYVIGDCYSAGTMIALSTDKIFLSHNGCLGPIDPQIFPGNSEMKLSWFPGLIGLVEALNRAFKEGEVSEGLREAFKDDWSALALYFKEKYTFKDLFGDYVKKHCAKESDFGKVWNYLSALNDSHSAPLTYKRLVKMGLDVELMVYDVEKAVKSIIRDVESEFGELRSKAAVYDLYNSSFDSEIYEGDFDDTEDDLIESISEKIENAEDIDKTNKFNKLNKSKVIEKLAIIETSVMGFIQTCEVGTVIEDGMPVDMQVISKGWDEELDSSVVSAEDKEEFNALLQYFVSIAIAQSGCEEDMDDKKYEAILTETNNRLSQLAVEALRASGVEVDLIPCSKRYALTVEYLITNPNLVEFDSELEVGLRQFASNAELDYDSLRPLEKLNLYGEFCEMVKMELGMTDEMFEKYTAEEQFKLLLKFCEKYCQ